MRSDRHRDVGPDGQNKRKLIDAFRNFASAPVRRD